MKRWLFTSLIALLAIALFGLAVVQSVSVQGSSADGDAIWATMLPTGQQLQSVVDSRINDRRLSVHYARAGPTIATIANVNVVINPISQGGDGIRLSWIEVQRNGGMGTAWYKAQDEKATYMVLSHGSARPLTLTA